MRALLAALLVVSSAAQADELANLPSAEQHAIQDVITDQIDAFRSDDAGRAFGYASPGIQFMFGNPQRFVAMVREGYQPVYHPRSMAFGDLLVVDGNLVQELAVIGPDGQPHLARYVMEHESDGSWRIDGCVLVARPPVS
jgi:ketosteroid isomerase-like protein